ncbi:transcription initiation factor IIF subunit alpha-like [Silene latifolia]|uniref:transcription initiation factor IIF subunit alpha-like n=1 Tax=Silene latifolia TaxID=37657 RepID=UPI003D772FB6
MSFDLMLKPNCGGCGSNTDLYGSNCKHLTLCSTCGKTMAETRAKCYQCGATLTRLIREYNVRQSSSIDKNYFIGRFAAGLPTFSNKNSSQNQWSLVKEGINGRHLTDSLKDKFKNKPWLLEDETGQSQYHGHLEGTQSATYYLLMLQGKEFVAIPAGSWYNFNKVAQYRQLTIEEAEEKMKNRRKTVDGYERWMMKTASNGPAAFGYHPELVKETPVVGGKGRKKSDAEADGNVSDKGEEDEGEQAARKSRLGLNNKKGSDDEDDEGRRGGDFDDDDDNIEKGDDWEHEEIFTDDDEAVGINPEEREDLLAPEVPAPPEIKEDDDEEEEDGDEEEGKLSKSGKELKKLLGRSNGLSDSDSEEEDDGSGKRKKDEDEDDDEDEDRPSPAVAPKLKDPKEEPSDSPAKPARGTSTSKSAKGKRKHGEDTKAATGAASKKIKAESDVKPTIKEEPSKGSGAGASKTTPSSSKTGTSSTQGPVREEEIRAVLLQRAPLTTSELVATFKARLKSPEDKKAFAEILKRISKIQKNNNLNYVVLRK